jgi:hypothetical protein
VEEGVDAGGRCRNWERASRGAGELPVSLSPSFPSFLSPSLPAPRFDFLLGSNPFLSCFLPLSLPSALRILC